ncbi:MAG: YigZ family protein, partial [Bacteroidota bacterium]
DVVVVVTRYFGGVKLGLGGLARAYGEAARAALCAGRAVTAHRTAHLAVSFPHAMTNRVLRLLHALGGVPVESRYEDTAHLTVRLRAGLAEEFAERLRDETRGSATCSPVLRR